MQTCQFRLLTFALFLTPLFLQAQAKFETFTLFSADTGIPVKKSTMGALGEDRQLRYSFRLATAVEPPEGQRFEGVTYAAGVIAAEATQPDTPQTVFKTNEEHPAGSSYYANMAADAPLLVGADELVDHFKYIQTLPKKVYPKDALPERLVDFKPSSLYPADTAPVPTYLGANAFINAGGKIGYVATKTFTLNPDKDAWDPYLMAYDREMEIHKFKKVSLFPDEDASYYTNALKGGKVLQLSAPQNGLLSMFGGLKYKKREDKDRSEQHEFQLLSFDQAGNVVHQEVIQSEEPLQLTTSYALAQGPYLNGNTRAASSFIFEAQGHPDGANAALRRLFWVDSQTGKLHKTIDFSLPSVHAVNAGIIDLPYSNFATVVYFHTFSENRGFTFVSLDKNTAEIVDIQNFDHAFIDRGGVPPSKIITAPKFIIDAVYGQDGHYLLQVVLQQSDEPSDLGKWLLDYDSNEGKLRHAITTPPNRRHVLLDQAASRIFFYTQEGDGPKARPALWAFGKGYDGLTNLLAADQELAGNFRYNVNYNAKLKMLFFMTRGVDGKGLYLHRLILESESALK